jgi:hypothetical protein
MAVCPIFAVWGEMFETNHKGRTVSASLAIGMFRSVGYWTDLWSEISLIFVPWTQFWLEEVSLILLYMNLEANVMKFTKMVPSYKQFVQRIWHDYDSMATTPISKACVEGAVWGSHCISVFRTNSPVPIRLQFQPHNCRPCTVDSENVMDARACEMRGDT